MFITFEGIDYSGKSTQAKLLYDYLKSKKIKTVLLREPGGTKISEKIREILLDRIHLEMTPITEFLLFSAARAQLVEQIIKPYLRKNYTVILDRYYDSSTAYQGYGGNIDIDKISAVNKIASHGLDPDITFLIDISPRLAFQRQKLREDSKDRMENKNLAFYNRVYKGFQKIANKNKKRFVVIDGEKSIEETRNTIIKIVNNKIKL
jgi:dTMP kinase